MVHIAHIDRCLSMWGSTNVMDIHNINKKLVGIGAVKQHRLPEMMFPV